MWNILSGVTQSAYGRIYFGGQYALGWKNCGKIAANDWQTKGILRFNDFIANDNRIEKVILPLRDGLTLIMKITLFYYERNTYLSTGN